MRQAVFLINGTAATAASPVTATSDTDGFVVVTVSSGSVQGNLFVRAEFDPDGIPSDSDNDGNEISVLSDQLSVGSGLASQGGITLSATNQNPEGWNHVNEPLTLTVNLEDNANIEVAEGTAVFFRSELGRITGEGNGSAVCYTDDTSSCSVTWLSNGAETTTDLHYADGPFEGLGLYQSCNTWS